MREVSLQHLSRGVGGEEREGRAHRAPREGHHQDAVWLILWVKGGGEERDDRLRALALHAPIQWAIEGDVVKSRGRSNLFVWG